MNGWAICNELTRWSDGECDSHCAEHKEKRVICDGLSQHADCSPAICATPFLCVAGNGGVPSSSILVVHGLPRRLAGDCDFGMWEVKYEDYPPP
jgi:hypothetical protein